MAALAEPVAIGVGQAVPDILNEAHVLDISGLRQAEPDLHASAALRASRPDAAAMLRRDDGLLAWLAAREWRDDPREAAGLMSNSDDETHKSTAASIENIDALFASVHDFELEAVQ